MDEENLEKALEVVKELIKQIMTLAVAVLALSPAVAKDLFKPPLKLQFSLPASWFFLFIASISGIAIFMRMAANIKSGNFDPWEKSLRIISIVQVSAFGLGILLFVVFVLINSMA
ncbi:hypothetical protein FJZ31_01225 [Candidatus Poribacteria bacterium]|nr:hypothetical protein [Candidatus Poribacteria bacterium]